MSNITKIIKEELIKRCKAYEKKTDYNVIISAITLCANIVIDIIFIKNWGIIGAAVGTLISTIIASALSLPYVFYLIYSEKGNANLLRTTMGENNE